MIGKSGFRHRWLALLAAVALGLLAVPVRIFHAQEPAQEQDDGDARKGAAEWRFRQRAYPRSFIPAQYRFEAMDYVKRRWGFEWKSPRRIEAQPADRWNEVGPNNVGGRTLAIALHPADDNTVYAGGADGGVFKTTDGGLTWTALQDQLPSLAIKSLALDPKNPDIIYAGTGEGYFNGDAALGKGVMKSTDAGATWSYGPVFSNYVNRLAIHPERTSWIYAAARDGVFRSTDGGGSWTAVLRGRNCMDLSMDPDNPDTLLVSVWDRSTSQTQNGIWKSTDGGQNWARISQGMPEGVLVGRVALARSPSRPAIVYAGVAQYYPPGTTALPALGIFKSTDAGASWGQLGGTPAYCGTQCWYDNELTVHPTDPDTVWAGGIYLWKTSDGGKTWARSDVGVHVDHHSMAISRRNPKLTYEGNDGGMYRSTDGGSTWLPLNYGYSVTQFYALSISAIDPTISYGGTQDNGTQKGSGATSFQQVLGADGMVPLVDYSNPNYVYAESQNGGLMRSTDGGISFTSARSGINTAETFNWVTPWVIDPVNPAILYVGGPRLYKSTNRAVSWTAISNDLTEGKSSLSAIAVAPSDTRILYAGTGSGLVWTATDGGAFAASFHKVSAGLPNRYVTRLAVHPTQPRTVYATFSGFNSATTIPGHVFKSLDGGESWTNISSDLPDLPVQVILIDPVDPRLLYLGTDLGCFRSFNDGASWEPFNNGLPNVVVDDMAYFGNTNFIRVATHGRGMWQFVTGNRRAAQLRVVAGDKQKAAVGVELLLPVRVAALDAGGVPVTGVELEFALLPAEAAGAFADGSTAARAVTDAYGTALLPRYRLGGAPGSASISVSASGVAPVAISIESVLSAPQLVRVEPDETLAGQGLISGQNITLTGSGFANPYFVYFVQNGSWYATTSNTYRLSDSQIAANVPSGLVPGSATIVVARNGEASAGLEIRIARSPSAPMLRELLPSAPSPGQQFMAVMNGPQLGTERFTLTQGADRYTGLSEYSNTVGYLAAGFTMPAYPFRPGLAQMELRNHNSPLAATYSLNIPSQPLIPNLLSPAVARAPGQLMAIAISSAGFAAVPQFNTAIFSQRGQTIESPGIAFSSGTFGSLVTAVPANLTTGPAEVQVRSLLANGDATTKALGFNLAAPSSITAPSLAPTSAAPGARVTVTSGSVGAFNTDPARNRVVLRSGGMEYPAAVLSLSPLGTVLAFAVPSDIPSGAATVQVSTEFAGQNVTRVQNGSMTVAASRTLSIFSGDGQVIEAGGIFPQPLGVKVSQANGSPVSGASVVFSAPAGGASGFFEIGAAATATVVTDSAGRAISPVFKSNLTGGAYFVRAGISGQPGVAVFALRNRKSSSSRQVEIAPHTARALETTGAEKATAAGYITLTSAGGKATGVSIFALRDSDGNLLSQAAVPSSTAARQSLMFVDIRPGVDTGVALVNPNSESAAVTLQLRDRQAGPVKSPITLNLAAGAQTARFFSELFGSMPGGFSGTASMTATLPVAAVTLRAATNTRGELIYSTLPVALPEALPPRGGSVSFPHLALGGGYRTTLLLLNPSGEAMAGTLRLFDSQGTPIRADASAPLVEYGIPPQGCFLLEMAGADSPGTVTGFAVVTAEPGSVAPTGTVLFSSTGNGVLVSEAAVPATPSVSRALLYVDNQPVELRDFTESNLTGLAIANRSGQSARIRLTLRNADGAVIGIPRTLEVEAGRQTSRFVEELMGSPAAGLRGSLELVADQPVEVLTLRGTYNARGEFLFTTMPVADYSAAVSPNLLFAHFADGGGYATQTIVLNAADAVTRVTQRFLGANGLGAVVDQK